MKEIKTKPRSGRPKLLESAARYGKSPYGQHLKQVAEDKIYY